MNKLDRELENMERKELIDLVKDLLDMAGIDESDDVIEIVWNKKKRKLVKQKMGV